jgi:hypothetical protein
MQGGNCNLKKLNKGDIRDIIRLTPVQEGMLYHYLKDPRRDYYFEQLSLEISGEIDVQLFERAWNLVIEANEMLRAVFRWDISLGKYRKAGANYFKEA